MPKGILTVMGRVGQEESGDAVYRETHVGDYKRQFTLGDDVDSEKIVGEIENGILTVRIAKPEAAKPRKIEILSEIDYNRYNPEGCYLPIWEKS